jgi:hypothetical protein
MIHVFFVPGMFGSTVEYVIRSHTQEYSPVSANIQDDGSMHSYKKQAHLLSHESIEDFFKNTSLHKEHSITTPIYPFNEIGLPAILDVYKNYTKPADKYILIYATDLHSAELNLLFMYYKIVNRKVSPNGLGLICGNNQHNIINWNLSYRHWSEMKIWELREWISLFYLGWVQSWIDSKSQVESEFLKLTNHDILHNTKESLLKIIDHCGLTNTKDLTEFVSDWQQAQQYIVDEFELLNQIVDCAIASKPLQWQPINIIAEAIVQQRLRAKGYEIRCDGLDKFPTDAIMFNTLLEKVQK